MPAELISRARLAAALAFTALAVLVSGCGGEDVQTTSASLEKPALTVPEGSVEAKSSSKGATSATGSTGDSGSDSSGDSGDSGAGTDTGTDTGGADTGTDTGGGNTGGDENTGGAGLGN